ncbi:MAG: hypothetical protein Q7S04_02600 [Candidatus Moranbacteria bacterium]|nr:hypothetical protein [Candidatus Moranbacteria bacterium]
MQFAVTRKHSEKGAVQLVRILDTATMEAAAAELNIPFDRLHECIGVNDVPFKRGFAGDGAWAYHVAHIDGVVPVVV